MTTRTCVINSQTGVVENIIELGGEVPATCAEHTEPPDGYLWIAHETACIGWAWDGTAFIAPPPVVAPEPPTPVPSAMKQMADLLVAKNVITPDDAAQFDQGGT